MGDVKTTGRAAKAALVREKGGAFLVEDVRIEAPRADEVLVRMVAVGICHTDAIMRDQYFPYPLPGIFGHEGSGVVEAVGSNVTHVAPGDHVVLSFMSCGTCSRCAAGEPAYCESFVPLNLGGQRGDGSTGICDCHGHAVHDHFFGQSSFASLSLAHGRNVVKVDPAVPLELLGPLGCGIQTGAGAVLNSLAVGYGASIAVFGVGGVGLSAVMAARVAGATTIIAVDVTPSRLQLARELGATHTINAAETDPVAAIQAITGSGAQFTLDTSGRPEVLRQAIDALAVRGTCGIVGAPPLGTEARFDVNMVMIPGRTIRGICEGDSVPSIFIPHLIELYKQGCFPFDRLVHFYPFEKINEAMTDSLQGKVIKPILRF